MSDVASPNELPICKDLNVEVEKDYTPVEIEDYEEKVAGIKEGDFDGYVDHIKPLLLDPIHLSFHKITTAFAVVILFLIYHSSNVVKVNYVA